MTSRPFLDTHVLVHAFTIEDRRSEVAKALVGAGGIVSVQGLNEFVSVIRRRFRHDWEIVAQRLRVLREVLEPPVALTDEAHLLTRICPDGTISPSATASSWLLRGAPGAASSTARICGMGR